MLKTPLCDVLGIEKPVFQGGMAWIADASLAAAVSEAGGLCIIAAMNADAEWLRGQIHELRCRTDKPFGVNVMLMSPFADEVAQVVIDEKVPVAVTGAGDPRRFMKGWLAAPASRSFRSSPRWHSPSSSSMPARPPPWRRARSPAATLASSPRWSSFRRSSTPFRGCRGPARASRR